MSKKDEPKKVEVEDGGNGFPDYKQAIEDKKVCATCMYGNGPFVIPLATQGPIAGGTPAATVRICGCFASQWFGRLSADKASCEQWGERPNESSRIVQAFKQPPPVKLGDLRGDKK